MSERNCRESVIVSGEKWNGMMYSSRDEVNTGANSLSTEEKKKK